MGISVTDRPLEASATAILAALKHIDAVISATPIAWRDLMVAVQQQTKFLKEIAVAAQQQTKFLKEIADTIVEQPSSTGDFSPPANLVTTRKVEVTMSVIQLEVGQTAVGKLTFDEIDPPADGAVVSDNPAVATIDLDANDHITWTCVATSVGTATISYTGTSAAPDVGPAVVPDMVVTVVDVPVAEHGDFDPADATISGP